MDNMKSLLIYFFFINQILLSEVADRRHYDNLLWFLLGHTHFPGSNEFYQLWFVFSLLLGMVLKRDIPPLLLEMPHGIVFSCGVLELVISVMLSKESQCFCYPHEYQKAFGLCITVLPSYAFPSFPLSLNHAFNISFFSLNYFVSRISCVSIIIVLCISLERWKYWNYKTESYTFVMDLCIRFCSPWYDFGSLVIINFKSLSFLLSILYISLKKWEFFCNISNQKYRWWLKLIFISLCWNNFFWIM